MTTSTQQEGPSQATQPPSQGISVPPSPGEEGVLAQAWSNNYILTPFYTGVVGAGVGVTVGALRGHSKLLWGLHMGIGYGIFGGVFSGTLYCMRQARSSEDDMLNWMVAGATSGATTSLLTGGPRKMPAGAMVFGTLGVVAQYVCGAVGDVVQSYKDSRAQQLLVPAGGQKKKGP